MELIIVSISYIHCLFSANLSSCDSLQCICFPTYIIASYDQCPCSDSKLDNVNFTCQVILTLHPSAVVVLTRWTLVLYYLDYLSDSKGHYMVSSHCNTSLALQNFSSEWICFHYILSEAFCCVHVMVYSAQILSIYKMLSIMLRYYCILYSDVNIISFIILGDGMWISAQWCCQA